MNKTAEKKDFTHPDEVRTFGHGHADMLTIGDGTVGLLTLEKGWRWSNDVKPIAGTELCEAAHFSYQLSGTLHIAMGDGTEFEVGPGEVTAIPPGHDAWVVGDEPVTIVDWNGASNYAKR